MPIWFNNGVNDGNIQFLTNDGSDIFCHSIVFYTQCDYGKSMNHFTSMNENLSLSTYTVPVLFPHKITLGVVASMYSTQFEFSEMNFMELIDTVQLVNFLIINRQDIKDKIGKQFRIQIKTDNWIQLLELLIERDNLEYLKYIEDYLIFEIYKTTDQIERVLENNFSTKNVQNYLKQLISDKHKTNIYRDYNRPNYVINLWNPKFELPDFTDIDPKIAAQEYEHIFNTLHDTLPIIDDIADMAMRKHIGLTFVPECNVSVIEKVNKWLDTIFSLIDFAWP